MVRHLRAQAHTLGRLLAVLASDTEADAARIAAQEARGTEAAGQLTALVRDNHRLVQELASQPQLGLELAAERQASTAAYKRFAVGACASVRRLLVLHHCCGCHRGQMPVQLEDAPCTARDYIGCRARLHLRRWPTRSS